jgi:hypothetical protein
MKSFATDEGFYIQEMALNSWLVEFPNHKIGVNNTILNTQQLSYVYYDKFMLIFQ